MTQVGGGLARIPRWVFVLAAVVFLGLGLWSLAERNWSGVIVSALLVVACGAATRHPPART